MSDRAIELRAEIDSLEKELTGLEALAAPQRAAAGDAARKHRRGELTATKLKEAIAARDAVDFALEQTKADLEEARDRLNEAESGAADEKLLTEIAAGTVDYREAEREHRELLKATEQALARAIVRSSELSKAASAAKTRAHDAAIVLAAKHDAPESDMLARAVNGTEVDALTGHEQISLWPFGRRQIYRLISQVKATTQGVSVDA